MRPRCGFKFDWVRAYNQSTMDFGRFAVEHRIEQRIEVPGCKEVSRITVLDGCPRQWRWPVYVKAWTIAESLLLGGQDCGKRWRMHLACMLKSSTGVRWTARVWIEKPLRRRSRRLETCSSSSRTQREETITHCCRTNCSGAALPGSINRLPALLGPGHRHQSRRFWRPPPQLVCKVLKLV